jgi:hypothetical protein
LQVGGVQDAEMVATPGWGDDTAQVVPLQAVLVPGASAAGSDEIHVSGGFGTMQPCTSTAVASSVSEVPLLTTKFVSLEYWPFTLSCIAMHRTGQVSK